MKTMKKSLYITLALAFIVLAPLAIRSGLPPDGDWVACRITTTAGDILVHVYPGQAPLTTANFLRYVEAGLYDGTSFFRVVTPDNQAGDKVRIEVVQGGDVAGEKCFPAIAHETTAMTGLKHGMGSSPWRARSRGRRQAASSSVSALSPSSTSGAGAIPTARASPPSAGS
jgi:cyclophilin family peptidyl-prolyl cis-trans isomerase